MKLPFNVLKINGAKKNKSTEEWNSVHLSLRFEGHEYFTMFKKSHFSCATHIWIKHEKTRRLFQKNPDMDN